MPGAIPGVGDCKICLETVPSLKILDCGHSLCSTCATKLLQPVQKKTKDQQGGYQIACPECRAITECPSQSTKSLKTRYFGHLKCDLCLEKKDSDDCWWCAECVRTICSKCSIKEHSKKGHTISEWNKLEPVKYSVNYISQVKFARQATTEAEHNRKIVTSFLSSLEDELRKELSSDPELDRIQTDLFDRYGTRFKQHQPLSSLHRASASSPNLLSKEKSSSVALQSDEGARVVAKVLQLAGSANVSESLVPSLSDQKFQLHFTTSPEEIAKYIRSKIEFIPFEQEESTQCKWRNPQGQTQNNTAGARHSYHTCMDRIREEEAPSTSTSTPSNDDTSSFSEDIFLSTSTPGKGDIVEMDFDSHELVALRYSTSEVCVLNLNTRRILSTVPVQAKHECRSVAFSETSGLLYLALQSTARRHEWMLEAIDLSKSPLSIIFTTPFDIDPEDRVEHLQLSISSNRRELGSVYEIRSCSRNVSEIWRASFERKSKSPSKVKMKEVMVYQKDESRFTQLLVAQTQNGGKEYNLFLWDDLSKSLYRLIVRDKRCHLCTKIITSPTPVPFSLDQRDFLWIFDPCTNSLCVTTDIALNRCPLTFREVHRYKKNGLHKLWADLSAPQGADFILATHVAQDSKSLKIVKFRKTHLSAEPKGFGDTRAAIKRRSFSARV